jgi:putative membrane protein
LKAPAFAGATASQAKAAITGARTRDAPSARLDRLARVPLFVYALIHWALNVLALLVADWIFDGFSIEKWGPVLLAGAVLGLANVFLKPLVTFIALPLILLTFGVAYFFVNVVMLLFTEWVTPDFSIDGFWTYVGATIVIWLVNWLGSLAIVAALDDD